MICISCKIYFFLFTDPHNSAGRFVGFSDVIGQMVRYPLIYTDQLSRSRFQWKKNKKNKQTIYNFLQRMCNRFDKLKCVADLTMIYNQFTVLNGTTNGLLISASPERNCSLLIFLENHFDFNRNGGNVIQKIEESLSYETIFLVKDYLTHLCLPFVLHWYGSCAMYFEILHKI